MIYEYYWLRHFIALTSSVGMGNALANRTNIFNTLGDEGWQLLPSLSKKHEFCFRRPSNPSKRIRYEYQWRRLWISPASDTQIQAGLDTRTKMFNTLSKQGYSPVMEDVSMFCFMRKERKG